MCCAYFVFELSFLLWLHCSGRWCGEIYPPDQIQCAHSAYHHGSAACSMSRKWGQPGIGMSATVTIYSLVVIHGGAGPSWCLHGLRVRGTLHLQRQWVHPNPPNPSSTPCASSIPNHKRDSWTDALLRLTSSSCDFFVGAARPPPSRPWVSTLSGTA